MEDKIISFEEAADFEAALPSFSLSSPSVAAIAESFRKNIHRLLALAHAPRSFMGMGAVYQFNWCQSCYEFCGDIEVKQSDDKYNDIVKRYLVLLNETLPIESQELRETLIGSVTRFAAKPGSFFYDALVSMVYAQITEIWTMLEIVAKDLWICAVNERPGRLRHAG